MSEQLEKLIDTTVDVCKKTIDSLENLNTAPEKINSVSTNNLRLFDKSSAKKTATFAEANGQSHTALKVAHKEFTGCQNELVSKDELKEETASAPSFSG